MVTPTTLNGSLLLTAYPTVLTRLMFFGQEL
jgi:hypothetical protein